MLLQYGALGVTMSWDEGFLGARASRPHQAWHSLGHLPHLDQPGTAPWHCFGLADGVPAHRVGQRDCLAQHRTPTWINRERPWLFGLADGVPAHRVAACSIALKLRAAKGTGCGRDARAPRRCRPGGAVGGVWRVTSQKADVHPPRGMRVNRKMAPPRFWVLSGRPSKCRTL